MLSTTKYIFDRDVLKDSERGFVVILWGLEAKLSKLIGAETVGLLFGWGYGRGTVEVDEMILPKREGGDFFIDLDEGIEVFTDDWEDALLGLHGRWSKYFKGSKYLIWIKNDLVSV